GKIIEELIPSIKRTSITRHLPIIGVSCFAIDYQRLYQSSSNFELENNSFVVEPGFELRFEESDPNQGSKTVRISSNQSNPVMVLWLENDNNLNSVTFNSNNVGVFPGSLVELKNKARIAVLQIK
ncbi:MAG: hypothetical protein ACRCXZ_07225, partial [Patescibacteria group bacterium]